MPLVEHDDLIEEIAAAVSDVALGNTILPRVLERHTLRLPTKSLHRFDNIDVESGITVADQILRSRVAGKGIAQLMGYPGAGRMAHHVEVQHTPPVMSDDEKTAEYFEAGTQDPRRRDRRTQPLLERGSGRRPRSRNSAVEGEVGRVGGRTFGQTVQARRGGLAHPVAFKEKEYALRGIPDQVPR